MKIAVVGSRNLPANYGGVETACENLYTQLTQKGVQVVAYCRSNGFSLEKTLFKGVRVISFPVPNLPGISTFLHCGLASLMATFSDADIIHFHAQGPALFSFIPRLLAPRKKIGFTCHGRDWQRERWGKLAKQIIKSGEVASAHLTDFRIMVSEDLRAYYESVYGVASTRLYNGVHQPQKAELKALKKKFGLEAGKYILFIGRLVPEKAPDVLIQAFNQVDTDVKLVIAGDAPETPEYVNQLKALAANNPNVIFTSYIRGVEIAEAYSNALAYISSSRLEGNPITALEAMSYGLPLVVSDIPPHREILSHYPNQHLPAFETGSIEACRDAIRRLVQLSPEACRRMGEESCEVVARYFNWNSVTEATYALYQQAMGGQVIPYVRREQQQEASTSAGENTARPEQQRELAGIK